MPKQKCYPPVPLTDIRISDPFWSRYLDLVKEVMLPYQWDALNDRIPGAEPSCAVQNFQIAAGLAQGEFQGEVFQDSDVAKWLEAAAYLLAAGPDPELEAVADGMIEIIEKAQRPDGYLDTYFIIKEPKKRWSNLYECHEMYVAGHIIEAAAAYYQATGKRRLLDVACRLADHIESVFGTEPEKIQGYPGHQEIELALVKLYQATQNEKYLALSKFFIDQRGKKPNYFQKEWEGTRDRRTFKTGAPVPPPDLKYNQSHEPVLQQEAAVGHAVRAVYMYSAMADLAREAGDQELLKSCRRLWDNIASKQLYITGGIGSTHNGEAFTFDYDLPNDTAYAETCASIGLIFFAHRMLQMDMDSRYGDVMERALYNVVLGSASRDGKRFFYVNPLEVWPKACGGNPDKQHVKPVRQKWFGCACCPPNVARLMASLNQYLYSTDEDTIYTHLYISGEAGIKIAGGEMRLKQESSYPWDGHIKFTVLSALPEDELSLGLRLPGWCRNWSVLFNGKPVPQPVVQKGYLKVAAHWHEGDTVELRLEMPVECLQANPQVRADAGKIAFQRGPLVYCLEECDNGANLSALSVDPGSAFSVFKDSQLLEGAVVIEGKGIRESEDGWGNHLYRPYKAAEKETKIRLIPYFLWANRAPGEMAVWIRRR